MYDSVVHLQRPGDAKAARREAQRRWRSFLTNDGDIEDSRERLAVGIASSFTTEAIVPMLGGELLAQGYRPAVIVGAYNQLFQICLDHAAAFPARPDAIVLLWRIEDLLELPFQRFVLDGIDGALEEGEKELALFADAVASLRRSFGGSIIVTLPMAPRTPFFEPLDLNAAGRGNLFHRRIALAWTRQIEQIGGVRQLDLDAIERCIGTDAAFDQRTWYLYRQPVSEFFLYEIAHQLGRILRAERHASAKCVVLDCDNTLWGGVVGEEGIDGIQIGQDFPGSAYREFQAFLSGLRRQGILLALCSKNNPGDVEEVFREHDAMLLRWQDISAHRIGWRPKWETIGEIAAELNIGTDSLVFIDDNAFEIEQVQRAYPEIRCIQLPDDPAFLLTKIRSHYFFDKLDITEEDRSRADMMRVEKERVATASSLSEKDFLETLRLVIDFVAAKPEHLGRVAQLVNKTNQFNLTTKRRTLDELRSLAQASAYRIFVVSVGDRFGEYGLVGVAIINVSDVTTWEIDTFLLSCRALGKGVETAILSLVARTAIAAGATTLRGLFTPTAKNNIASGFYERMGLVRTGPTAWEAPANAISEPATHLIIRSE